jgi:hypothetical protein
VHDPRLCMDKSHSLPWEVAQSNGRHEAAFALHPSTHWPALLLQAGIVAIPLPSLACIAAKVLQSKLKWCLEASVRRQGTASRMAHDLPSTGGAQGQAGSGSSDEEDDDNLCEVCMSAPLQVALQPCQHALCASCATQLCDLMHAAPLTCPFCRAPAASFAPSPFPS